MRLAASANVAGPPDADRIPAKAMLGRSGNTKRSGERLDSFQGLKGTPLFGPGSASFRDAAGEPVTTMSRQFR